MVVNSKKRKPYILKNKNVLKSNKQNNTLYINTNKIIEPNLIKNNIVEIKNLLKELEEELNNLPDKRSNIAKRSYLKETIEHLKNQKKNLLEKTLQYNVNQQKKANILDRYIDQIQMKSDMETNQVNRILDDVSNNCLYAKKMDCCPKCNIPFLLDILHSEMVCNKCGYRSQYTDTTTNSIQYGDEVEFNMSHYKRIVYFNQLLYNTQGKSKILISDEVLNDVMKALYKQGIRKKSEINCYKVRQALKSYDKTHKEKQYNKLYGYVSQITSKIKNEDPPQFEPDQEEKLKVMFLKIQTPFEKHCPEDRSNFLYYPYFLYKSCELLGYIDHIDWIVLLKSKKKVSYLDILWEKICNDMNWEYRPTTVY